METNSLYRKRATLATSLVTCRQRQKVVVPARATIQHKPHALQAALRHARSRRNLVGDVRGILPHSADHRRGQRRQKEEGDKVEARFGHDYAAFMQRLSVVA